MVSRAIVIVLAIGAAVYRAGQGAVVEATGLSGLAAGLIALKLAGTRPVMKPVAILCFSVTAVAMLIVFLR